MTEVSARAAAAANYAPPRAEAQEQALAPVDAALFAAFEGYFEPVYGLEPDDQRAVAAAARCFGLDPPADLDSRILSFEEVASRLQDTQSVTNRYLAAEKLGGARTRAEKALSIGAATAKVAVFLPDLLLSVAGTAAGAVHYDKTATGFEVAGALARSPHTFAEFIKQAGPNRLFKVVRRFVIDRYGVEYNNNPALVMGWLRASVLGAAAKAPGTSDGTLQQLALDFMAASKGVVMRGKVEKGKRPDGAGVPILRLDLRDGVPIRMAAAGFADEEAAAKAARDQANRDYFKPKPSRRPSGEALEELRLSSQRYEGLVVSSFETQRDNLRECLRAVAGSDDILASGPYKALAEAWAAITERAYLPHHERPAFARLLHDNKPLAAAYVGWYLGEAVEDLREGKAPIGVVRLAADLGHPTYKGAALGTVRNQDVLRALNEAAFDWFDQSLEHYSHMPSIRLATREAYLAARFKLAGSMYPDLNLGRAIRLASVIPDKRDHGALCNAVSSMLNAAAATTKAGLRGRRR